MPGKSKTYALIVLIFVIGLGSGGIIYSRLHTDRVIAGFSSDAPSLWYSPLELNFEPLGVGDTSSAQVVHITNVGGVTLNFTGGEPGDENFSANQDCSGGLGPGDSCHFFYRFTPQAAGVLTTTAGPSSEAGKIEVVLKGTAVGPDFTYNARSLDFGQVLVGNSSGQQVVKIKNTGMAELVFSGGAVSDPFSVTQDCAPALAPGDSCEYFYTFTPASSGMFTVTTGPNSNAGKQMLVDLAGEGISSPDQYAGFSVSPLEIDFGPVGVGLTSDTQVVTITNQGDNILSDFTGGGVRLPFTGSKSCDIVQPFGQCQYYFDFEPTESGVFSATSSSITSLGPFSVSLRGSGQGTSLSVSPLSIDFGPVPPGTMSEPQVVTITNSGPVPLTDISGGGVYSPFSGHQNCPISLPPGESCQYTFFFSPTELGRFTASSDSSSSGGAFSIQLAGGVIPAHILKRFSPAVVAPRAASTLELSITNPNATVALDEVAFEDTLPPGLRVADPTEYSVSAECGGPVFSPQSGDVLLSFSGGTILGSKTCLIQVAVTADASGSYPNQTALVSTSNAGLGDSAVATLFVGFRLFMPAIFR